MKTAVQRWGNSLAIRIPRAFAQEKRLGNGSQVDIQLNSGMLVISLVPQNRYALRDLLAAVQKTNVHSETKWGAPMGKEVW
jgi:antitoxin MazE